MISKRMLSLQSEQPAEFHTLDRPRRVRHGLVVGLATAAILAVSVPACSSSSTAELKPASGPADQARRGGTVASNNGVELRLLSDSWKGASAVLRYASPVLVSITNHSGQSIRIESAQFQLSAPDGSTYSPMTASEVANEMDRHALGVPEPSQESPTADVYFRALKDGILRSGGTKTGFVFFETPSRGERDMTLSARFEPVATGNTAANITVPMLVR